MYILKNENGVEKKVKKGVSWTFLFWGALVPLFRGDWKWALISFLAIPATFGIFWIIMIVKYNEWYLNDLLNDGYVIQ